MIDIDAVRSAVLADKPYQELDTLVRAEVASGRSVGRICGDLLTMTEALRATPGYGERAEEAFFDTLDRLIGFCPQDSACENATPTVAPAAPETA